MEDLTTHYLGLKLRNPIIIGSSGLTNSVAKIQDLEEQGAGAVVLKSLFEEQITADIKESINADDTKYTEAYDLISRYVKEHSLEEYLNLIREAKKSVNIPIIASIHCTSQNEWITFAKRIEEAGADALELNISILPSDEFLSGKENEHLHFEIIKSVKKHTSLPLALKMGQYSAGLAKFITELSWSGDLKGLVLFNRHYSPDIDIENYQIISSNLYSRPEEVTTSLRWIAIMSGKIDTDLVASTGVHNGASVVKQILAGASAVQVVSAIYQNGPAHIQSILNTLQQWMNRKSYENLDEFRGKMSLKRSTNAAAFERTQFMRYFAGME